MNTHKTIKSLSFFFLTFVYCFVLGLILEGEISWQSLSYKVSLMIAIPLGIAIYSRYSKSIAQDETKIYSRMIFGALWSSLLISIIIEILTFTSRGEAAIGAIIWPVYALGYILIECLTSLIIAGYIRLYTEKTQLRIALKRALIFILLIPYLVVIFDHIQKATTNAYDCGLDVCSNGNDALSLGMLIVFPIIALGLPFIAVRRK